MNHLRDVESYIQERPDSALKVLREIPPQSLSTKHLRGYSSLLHSQALDKCYIDLQTDSIIFPAVSFYSRHGSPDHRLKMCYYQAQIYQNAGDLDSAMKWLVRGEKFVPKCTDYSAAGRLFSVKTELYYYVYDFKKAKSNIAKAVDLYEKDENISSIAIALLDQASINILSRDYTSAFQSLDHCRKYWDSLSLQRKSVWYKRKFELELNSDSIDIDSLTAQCINELKNEAAMPWLVITDMYLKQGDASAAEESLNKYVQYHPKEEHSRAHLLRLYQIQEMNGMYESALDTYKQYFDIVGNKDLNVYRGETKFVEERIGSGLLHQHDRNTIIIMFLFIATISMICLETVAYSKRVKNKHQKIAEMLDDIMNERDYLLSLVDNGVFLDSETAGQINKRLSIMNNLLAAKITGNKSIDRDSELQMTKLVNEKDAFMTSVVLQFSVGHQNFIQYLKKYNLTDREIGFCCIYALGIKGSQISSYLTNTASQTAYNINLSIRQKLKEVIGDSNLSTFLISLLYQSEIHS